MPETYKRGLRFSGALGGSPIIPPSKKSNPARRESFSAFKAVDGATALRSTRSGLALWMLAKSHILLTKRKASSGRIIESITSTSSYKFSKLPTSVIPPLFAKSLVLFERPSSADTTL